MIVEVIQNKNKILNQHVLPDVIFNRFDLLFADDYELYQIDDWYIPVKLKSDNKKKAYLEPGLYLRAVPADVLYKFYDFLFEKYPNAEYIKVQHSYTPVGDAEQYPYWHIELPATREEFDKALSARVRYNTKWYPKIIRKELGEFNITKYSANEITEKMLRQFFDWKSQTHGWEYKNSPLDAIQEWGITACYVLTVDDVIHAVGCICETGDNAWFWNFAYNPAPEYKRYSLGMVVYYHIICDMIEMGKKVFYLSGGWLDYKKWYNGILTYTYSGNVPNPNIKRRKHHGFWWHLRHLKF